MNLPKKNTNTTRAGGRQFKIDDVENWVMDKMMNDMMASYKPLPTIVTQGMERISPKVDETIKK